MLECEVLVGEGLVAPDCGGAGTIAVDEVTALTHEFGDLDSNRSAGTLICKQSIAIVTAVERKRPYDSVKLGPLVSLWPAGSVLRFAGAELAEVLSGLGDYIGEELKCDASKRLACEMLVT